MSEVRIVGPSTSVVEDSQPSIVSDHRTKRAGNATNLRELIARFGVVISFLIMVAVFASQSANFLTLTNARIILLQCTVLGVAAVGTTLLLIAGRIDISQGAFMAFSGVLVAELLVSGVNPIVAIAVTLLVGALLGLVNGFFSEIVLMPAFIATLGMALVLRGVATAYLGGQTVAITGPGADLFSALGLGSIGPVPWAVVVMAAVYLVFWFVSRRTAWGLQTYAVGSSARASLVAGVRVTRHRILLFVTAGALSSLAGVLLAARLGSGAGNNGNGAEFDICAAVVLGGTSLYGGRGGIPQTLLGIVFLTTLANGLVQMNVSSFYQGIATGFVLLAALTLDRLRVGRESA